MNEKQSRRIHKETIASAIVAALVVFGFGNGTVAIVVIGLMHMVDVPTLVESYRSEVNQ